MNVFLLRNGQLGLRRAVRWTGWTAPPDHHFKLFYMYMLGDVDTSTHILHAVVPAVVDRTVVWLKHRRYVLERTV